jgi:hypothetical protein
MQHRKPPRDIPTTIHSTFTALEDINSFVLNCKVFFFIQNIFWDGLMLGHKEIWYDMICLKSFSEKCFLIEHIQCYLVLFCPVSCPDPDPGLHKLPYLNFCGVCKSHKDFSNLCCVTVWFKNILIRAYCRKKISRRNLPENLFRLGSRSGIFQTWDPDPVKNFPDKQHYPCYAVK